MMCNFKDMIELAKSKGLTNEKKMWQSVAAMDSILDIVEKEHPDEYEAWLGKQHEILFGPHYNLELATEDLSKIFYTDRNGQKHSGPKWSLQEIVDGTRNFSFHSSVTDYDKWVAFNVWYADLNRDLDDAMILKTAFRFFFNDEDAGEGKIWNYMRAMF